MNCVACRHEMVARESVVTDHVTSHRGGNTSHRGGNTSHRGGNVLTAVGMFPPRWKYFSPRWEYSHRGGNVLTAVGMVGVCSDRLRKRGGVLGAGPAPPPHSHAKHRIYECSPSEKHTPIPLILVLKNNPFSCKTRTFSL